MSLEYFFSPRSIAIVGISVDTARKNQGQNYLDSLLNCGFQGQIFLVNPKGGHHQGYTVYPDISVVDDAIDLVICCIPATQVPQLIKDCAAKGVKAILCYTAGFSELGTDEGRRAEAELVQLAKRYGISFVGPNCLGIYRPKHGISFTPDFPGESGTVAFFCQSGGNTAYIVRLGIQRGLRFSKAISYGNACTINESDLLEYLTADPETNIIAAYIEGVRDGKRFNQALQAACRVKPVILLKGGMTEAGARATALHTGSLAGSSTVWNSLLQQAGAIGVSSLEEIIDVLVTFRYLGIPKGRNIAAVGTGGGAAVIATDQLAAANLIVPRLSIDVQTELLRAFGMGIGTSFGNPVDMSTNVRSPAIYDVLKILAAYSGCDILLFNVALGLMSANYPFPDEGLDNMLSAVVRVHRECQKPMVVVVSGGITIEDWQKGYDFQRRCQQEGIPVYFSIEDAAKAIDLFMRYQESSCRQID